MKKLISFLLVICMLSMSSIIFAEGTTVDDEIVDTEIEYLSKKEEAQAEKMLKEIEKNISLANKQTQNEMQMIHELKK